MIFVVEVEVKVDLAMIKGMGKVQLEVILEIELQKEGVLLFLVELYVGLVLALRLLDGEPKPFLYIFLIFKAVVSELDIQFCMVLYLKESLSFEEVELIIEILGG